MVKVLVEVSTLPLDGKGPCKILKISNYQHILKQGLLLWKGDECGIDRLIEVIPFQINSRKNLLRLNPDYCVELGESIL